MDAERIPARIAKGLAIIRNEVSKLDAASVEGRAFEARLAVKTIKDECAHLRQCVGQLVERTQYRAD